MSGTKTVDIGGKVIEKDLGDGDPIYSNVGDGAVDVHDKCGAVEGKVDGAHGVSEAGKGGNPFDIEDDVRNAEKKAARQHLGSDVIKNDNFSFDNLELRNIGKKIDEKIANMKKETGAKKKKKEKGKSVFYDIPM